MQQLGAGSGDQGAGGQLPATTGLNAAGPVHSGSCRRRALWELSQKSPLSCCDGRRRGESGGFLWFRTFWGALGTVRRPPTPPKWPGAFYSRCRDTTERPGGWKEGPAVAGRARGASGGYGSTWDPVPTDLGRLKAFCLGHIGGTSVSGSRGVRSCAVVGALHPSPFASPRSALPG